MAFQGRLTPQIAEHFDLSVVEIALTEWGNLGTGADANSLQYPVAGERQGIIPSLAAIAIAPRSTVDRVIVRQTPGPSIVNVSPVIPADLFRPDEFEVSVNAPALISTPGAITIRAHETSWYDDSYVQNGQLALASNFGGANDDFIKPILRLLLYFRPPIGTPVRVPYYFPDRESNATRELLAADEGTEQTLFIVPAAGRGHVQFSARVNTPGSDAVLSFKFTAIDYGSFFNSAAPHNCERLLGTTTINAAAGEVVDFAMPITAQYFAVYFTIENMTGGPDDLEFFVRMTDCCDGRDYITPAGT